MFTFNRSNTHLILEKKKNSCIWETLNLSTCAEKAPKPKKLRKKYHKYVSCAEEDPQVFASATQNINYWFRYFLFSILCWTGCEKAHIYVSCIICHTSPVTWPPLYAAVIWSICLLLICCHSPGPGILPLVPSCHLLKIWRVTASSYWGRHNGGKWYGKRRQNLLIKKIYIYEN